VEGGAVQAVAFVPDAAAEGIDDATCDIQPKPRPVLRVFRVNLAVANRRQPRSTRMQSYDLTAK